MNRRCGSCTLTSRICVKYGTRREGNMQGKIVNVFWLDRHDHGPRVNRRHGSRTLTLSRICMKCGTAMAVPAAPVATALQIT